MRAFLGLGSNLGDRLGNIARAIKLLGDSPSVKVLRQASLYETEPVGVEDQPWFINTALEIETGLAPQELYALCKEIEKKIGRKERGRWRPREIDLDILLLGDLVIEQDNLQIPHPQMHQRRFVLVPLVELNGQLVHPKLNKTMKELLESLADKKEVRLLSKRF